MFSVNLYKRRPIFYDLDFDIYHKDHSSEDFSRRLLFIKKLLTIEVK